MATIIRKSAQISYIVIISANEQVEMLSKTETVNTHYLNIQKMTATSLRSMKLAAQSTRNTIKYMQDVLQMPKSVKQEIDQLVDQGNLLSHLAKKQRQI